MKRVTSFAIAISATMLVACGGNRSMPGAPSSISPSPVPAVSKDTGTGQTFMLRGVVREGSTLNVLSGVRVVVVSGPDAGQTVTSGAGGVFTFDNLSPGTLTLKLSREGYMPSSDDSLAVSGTTYVDEWMFPVPPRDAGGASATARCGDGSWTWAGTSVDACTGHDGIAYPVCPGPLCMNDDHAGRVRF